MYCKVSSLEAAEVAEAAMEKQGGMQGKRLRAKTLPMAEAAEDMVLVAEALVKGQPEGEEVEK